VVTSLMSLASVANANFKCPASYSDAKFGAPPAVDANGAAATS
jgi:hypothetical protein